MPDPLPPRAHLKSRIAAVLTAPAIGTVVARVCRDRIPSAVGRIDTASEAIPPEVKARLAFRLYERAELRFVDTELRIDLPVVELGASIGVLTRAIARRVGAPHQILAVEANPDLIGSLERNLAAAGIADRVAVVHAAISPGALTGATVALELGRTSTDARLARPGATRTTDRVMVEVPAVSLQDLIEAHGLSSGYSLVCDIEGAEAALILRDRDALANCRQAIMELHDTEVDGRAIAWPELLDLVPAQTGMRLLHHHGPVAVFGR